MNLLGAGHDLSLPDWGPYSKNFVGISHISDKTKGWRFDFSLSPGLFRRNFMVPDVRTESQYFPWESAPDLSYYCHRHELEWKDRVYTDMSFSTINDKSRLFRCEIVNATDVKQSIHLLYTANLTFPSHCPAVPILPEQAFWIDALDYDKLQFAKSRPQDNLNYDGSKRGEERKDNFVNASAIANAFGQDVDDSIEFCFQSQYPIADALLLLRYRITDGEKLILRTQEIIEQDIVLTGTGNIELLKIPAGQICKEEEYRLELTSCGGAKLELDGFAVCPSNTANKVSFQLEARNTKPEIINSPEIKNGAILKYPGLSFYYGIKWNYDSAICRLLTSSDLKKTTDYNRALYNAYCNEAFFVMENADYYYSMLLTPVALTPHSTKVMSGIICNGSLNEVQEILAGDCSPEYTKEVYELNRANKVELPHSENGKAKLFSQQMMAAVNLLNIVFPIYVKRGYVRHRTPGRIFNSLYTWDSGFIGLGLLEVDFQQALENLDAYLTEPGDEETAFIHHGTPVPVQIYLFKELYNRVNDREMLEYFYPRLKQFHDFLTGKIGSSTTAALKSGMLKTWDYFYNSAGWDDYPPQWSVEEDKALTKTVAPAINTVHAVRTAKILRHFARTLGKTEDVEIFNQEIAHFSQALQEHSWDEDAGYFSYVMHDDKGEPQEFYRYSNGENYNKGLDGVSPLIAGIGTESQNERMFEHLQSPKELWTKAGLSTVDQSAAYFRNDGYWNGAVWMPYQWFLWKACLDCGRADVAWKIANTALNVWQNEVNYSYSCFEHFSIETGRGGGWYQFSGLSTPVLCFYSAYYRPGHLTGGFDLWIQESDYSVDVLTAQVELEGVSGQYSTIIAVMPSGKKHAVYYGANIIAHHERLDGVLEISLPCDSAEKLVIK
jgi:Mannosylglycerate hydrolase MGH1-like glycoside hydrolase domain